MNRSSRRHITHSIKVAFILKMVLYTALLAVAGISYVYLKNQEQEYGKLQQRLEKDLAHLHASNEVIDAQIASLSSRAFLENRLKKDPLGLVPIANEQIVRLNPHRDGAADELRVVSNRGFNKER